ALHVDRAAYPDAAVGDLAAERIARPAIALDLDDVAVRGEQERRLRVVAGNPADQVRASGRRFEDDRREPNGAERLGEVRDERRLVARRIDGDEADQRLELRDGLV